MIKWLKRKNKSKCLIWKFMNCKPIRSSIRGQLLILWKEISILRRLLSSLISIPPNKKRHCHPPIKRKKACLSWKLALSKNIHRNKKEVPKIMEKLIYHLCIKTIILLHTKIRDNRHRIRLLLQVKGTHSLWATSTM